LPGQDRDAIGVNERRPFTLSKPGRAQRLARVAAGSARGVVEAIADGTRAVALFNRGLQSATMTVRWRDIDLRGAQPVRDLWQQRAVGTFDDHFNAMVPAHGALLVKVGRPRVQQP
jgi:hypothetical protein